MGYTVGHIDHRDVGYGVPSYCDHPDCFAEIDRGMAYCCGGGPFEDAGCHLYFCSDHLFFAVVDSEGNVVDRDALEEEAEESGAEVDDSGWSYVDFCARCSEGKPPFHAKRDHPDWVWWKLNHPSWREWRDEQTGKSLEQMKRYLSDLAYHPSQDLLDEAFDTDAPDV